jgi:flavin reductase (DIM6/NTAB) family NADH-FMN oxidoreductase RutF
MTQQFKAQNFNLEHSATIPQDGSVEAANLKLALRTLGGGVSIITTGEGDTRTGATVTSATALSVDPPRMLVSLNRSSSTWPVLEKSRSFAINIIGSKHETIANQFAGLGGLKGPERYSHVIVIGKVVAIRQGEGQSLLYQSGRYHHLGQSIVP